MNLSLHPSYGRIVISYGLLILTTIMTPKIIPTLSSFFLNLQLYVFLVPMLSLFALSGRSLLFLTGVSACHMLQCLIIRLPRPRLINKKVCLNNNRILLRFVLFLSVVGIGGAIFIQSGLRGLVAFDLYRVYEVRNTEIHLSTAMSYFVPWGTKVIIPFLTVYFLHRRKWAGMSACILIQLYLYSIFAQKTFLFTPVLVIGIYVLIKNNWLKMGFEKGFPALVFFSAVIYWMNPQWIMPVNLFVRRVLYVPATLKFSFYEFFNHKPKVCMADGLIGKIFQIDSPYDDKIPRVIAKYVGRPGANCNTGYWGDAYANLGWFGVLLFSVIIIVFIMLLENLSRNVSCAVVIASCSYLFYSLNDAALLTTLLTGGGIVLLLIYLFNSMQYKDEKFKEKSKNST